MATVVLLTVFRKEIAPVRPLLPWDVGVGGVHGSPRGPTLNIDKQLVAACRASIRPPSGLPLAALAAVLGSRWFSVALATGWRDCCTQYLVSWLQLVKWLVIQTSSLSDKSVIGEMSPEAIGTCLAVALTLCVPRGSA